MLDAHATSRAVTGPQTDAAAPFEKPPFAAVLWCPRTQMTASRTKLSLAAWWLAVSARPVV